MAKKEGTFVNDLLLTLDSAGRALSVIFETPHGWRHRALHGGSYQTYRNTVYNLAKRGAIEIIKKNSQRFLKLTAKGELEALLVKAKMPVQEKWDGKWRMIIFDIPEETKVKRDQLRELLKKNNFYKLQASVYIYPYSLNRGAISYLQKTGLIDYIRMARVDEMDNDKDLQKKFKLS
jgi:phenylacetic acid degradation operon negative regulatory protein